MLKDKTKFEPGSVDLFKENIDKLKELFPQVVTDGEIDFEILKSILDKNLSDSKEKYQFTWNGKSRTIKLAQTPSNATLLPSKKDSKDWDTTENLYIEGDNLEVLKLLQKTYFNKIKMIYIDPPYNTGGDFVYKDDFKDTIKNYKEQTEQTTRVNPETSGRYHTDWLNMMYSRLMLAKNLLSDDGVIFVSIDDNEVENLKKIMNEIYGENGFVSQIVWHKKTQPSFLSKEFICVTEYILCYKKTSQSLIFYGGLTDVNKEIELLNISNEYSTRVLNKDKVIVSHNFSGEIKKGEYGNSSLKIEILDDLLILNGKFNQDIKIRGRFKWKQEKIDEELSKGSLILIKSTKTFRPTIKRFEGSEPNIKPPTNLLSKLINHFPTNTDATNEIKSLFNDYSIFDYPKPTKLLNFLIESVSFASTNSIILDFFSGSATTAHAVMQLNAEDGGNRKFIMVQLPEKTTEDSEAYKAGYKNICEIGKERIRRAGELVKKDLIEKNAKLDKDEEKVDPSKLDIGFKVFKLEESNFKEWDSSKEPTIEQLELFADPIKEGKSEEDVLYEVLLKYGVFDQEVKKIKINKKDVYSISDNYLIVMLSNKITPEDVEEIKKLKPKIVIFRDSGFNGNDTIKINAFYTLLNQV
jgi:adenine-specific DNA-methyltransferase